MQGPRGTGPAAVAAADAVQAVGVLPDGDVQRAGLLALAAGGAGILVHLIAVKGELVEGGVQGAQGAEVPAERPADKHRQHQQHRQDGRFPGKQPADGPLQALVGGHQGDAPEEGPRGAQVFAEPGLPLAHDVHHEQGQQDHQQGQDHEPQPF